MFMGSNLHRKVSAPELARMVRLSAAHLSELFRRETGTSLARYYRQLRLEHARHLLETTFLSVKEVAANVGFGLSHFVRDFAKVYGVSPRRYAALHRTMAK
jgi:transcriptional regulator GlxA family with amidase domain